MGREERVNVSRLAIAKWESDSGVPEISNLKMSSELFSVSIDTLIDDTKGIAETHFKRCVKDSCSAYVGKYSDIKLTGWNDGDFYVGYRIEKEVLWGTSKTNN